MFFVMVNHPQVDVPAFCLIDENDEMAFFETEEKARLAISNCQFDLDYGYEYEIFELGTGSKIK